MAHLIPNTATIVLVELDDLHGSEQILFFLETPVSCKTGSSGELIFGHLFELKKSVMKPSIPFLPLAVMVPLQERDTVPMREHILILLCPRINGEEVCYIASESYATAPQAP